MYKPIISKNFTTVAKLLSLLNATISYSKMSALLIRRKMHRSQNLIGYFQYCYHHYVQWYALYSYTSWLQPFNTIPIKKKSGSRLWILKGGENYKNKQRLLNIDQLNYKYSSKFVTFVIFTSFENIQSTPSSHDAYLTLACSNLIKSNQR